ncbi:MAG: hypothetical protein U0414_05145 [Polyangiaceae bacterium]
MKGVAPCVGIAAMTLACAACLTEVPAPALAPAPPKGDEAIAEGRLLPLTQAPPMTGPRRAEVTAIPFDLASVPEMEPAEVEPSAGFTLYTQDVDPVCESPARGRKYVGMGIRGELQPRTVLQVGAAHPPFARLDGTWDGADDVLATARLNRGAAVWTEIVPVAHRDALDVARYEGGIDDSRWHAVARSKLVVRATALVPGAIYAYRRAGVLGVVAPPAVWTSWSEEYTPTSPRERFTLVEIPLRAGEGGSVTITYERALAAALHTIVATAEGRPVAAPDAFDIASVEVVWPAGGAPELTVYAGPAHGRLEDLVPSGGARDTPHCFESAPF